MVERSKGVMLRTDRSLLNFGEYSGDAPEEEEPRRLSWRDHPQDTLSDWTIVVKATPPVAGVTSSADRYRFFAQGAGGRDGISDLETYHVHKALLGAGERPCEYFKRVFRGGGAVMREGASQMSELELDISAAAAFPVFLDFVYTGVLQATTEIATALFHLAEYVRCRALYKAVVDYMREDLDPKTAPIYLSEASNYSLETVADTALEMVVTNLHMVPEAKLYALPPPLFARVMRSPEKCPAEEVPASVLLTRYCDGPHAELIDGPFIASITDAMSDIDPGVSFRLLELGFQYLPENTSLRERCIEACEKGWQGDLLHRTETSLKDTCSETASPEDKATRGFTEDAAAVPHSPSMPTLLLGSTVPAEWQTHILGRALATASKANEALCAAGQIAEQALQKANQENQQKLKNERKLRVDNEKNLKEQLEWVKQKYARCDVSLRCKRCCLAAINAHR